MDLFLYYFKSFLLGSVQGFSEFIPISSTAHLLMGVEFLGLELDDFMKSFVIIIQLASILAVIYLYWNKIFSNFLIYFKKVSVAFIPTAIIGLAVYSFVRSFLQESFLVMSIALFVGGILIIILENFYKKRNNLNNEKSLDLSDYLSEISYRKCFYIGVFQVIAVIPGVSRSAATIFGGLSLGLSRRAIVEFSFLLAIPTMAAASGLDLIRSGASFDSGQFIFLSIGFLFSFLVALFSIKFLINFIKRNNFKPFGWYRIFIGLFLLIYIVFIK